MSELLDPICGVCGFPSSAHEVTHPKVKPTPKPRVVTHFAVQLAMCASWVTAGIVNLDVRPLYAQAIVSGAIFVLWMVELWRRP